MKTTPTVGSADTFPSRQSKAHCDSIARTIRVCKEAQEQFGNKIKPTLAKGQVSHFEVSITKTWGALPK